MKVYGILCRSVDTCGGLWRATEVYGLLCRLMLTYRGLWRPKEVYVGL